MKALRTLLVPIVLLTAQCTMTPKSTLPATDVGLWTGKVQMTNKTTNHRKWANVAWASNSVDDQMRIDISAIFDVPVATYIKNEEGAHLWLFSEKKYYFSQDSQKLFQHLTKLSVNPKIFYTMLGHPEKLGAPWHCKLGSSSMECVARSNNTQLFVDHEVRDERVINIEKGSKALRIRLSRSKVQPNSQVFKTLSTSQFKTIKI